ncbi:hypothetical protein [Pseudomonas sp. GXZC]|uniref:hypothetical protein n=1 Tax=Pseudomonas sp. GXZC TaxID=3003351 RepID=UPI0022AABDA5|nr:hypothetical protein [Pseudomonas sp. GXZC]WAT32207.1 hypothetical protein OZ428_33555 [Pseudomonas sp. GXZC]
MNQSFELCLSARLQWIDVVVCSEIREGEKYVAAARRRAFETLDCLAELEANSCNPVYGERVPPLLVETPELADHYLTALGQERELVEELYAEEEARRQKERLETEVERERLARRAQALTCIEAGRWSELDLPTPEDFLQQLAAGESVDAHGHTFSYDEGDDVIWMDNPYNSPGGFSGTPTLVMCREILTHIGCGGMYGPEP